MPKFIIDENLPYKFSLWKNDNFVHVYDLEFLNTDNDIWNYSKLNDLVIVTKDSDFSDLMLLNEPPPKVIHIKIGNMRINSLYQFLNSIWVEVTELSKYHKLIKIYSDRIETIK